MDINIFGQSFSFSNTSHNKTGLGSLQARIIIMILTLACSLVGMRFTNVLAAGTTYYVNNTNSSCSDTGTGTTSALPFCKISKGASVAVAGDTVRVLAGTYAETVTVPKSGSAGLPITYSAVPGVTVTGASGYGFRVSGRSYITIDGFSVTDTSNVGISVVTSNHVIVSNNHVSLAGSPVSGSARAGIRFDATTYSTINGNTTDHNSSHGIYLSGKSSGNTISDNISFANASGYVRVANGINIYASNSNTILHNITYANEDSGIQLYSGSTGNLIMGNLTYGNADHGIDISVCPGNTVVGSTVQGNYTAGINVEGNSGGTTLANNIAVDNGINIVGSGQPGNIRVDASSVTGTTINYDIVLLTGVGSSLIQWNGTNYPTLAAFRTVFPAQEVNGLQANPLFVAPVTPAVRPNAGNGGLPVVNVGDYHIAAGSPAIDSANSNAPSEPLLDIAGNARVDDPATANTGTGVRTYDDRGSYEFQPGSGAPTPTPTSTSTATPTITPTPTNTNTPILTNTPTPTFTTTPTATFTSTGTALPPTATFTSTPTAIPPTATFTSTPGTGSTLTFLADADSYVNQAGVNSNYGTSTQLWVDYDATASYESYLKFTVSGLSGTVQSATLRVYSTSSTVDGPAVYATTNDWTETGITWNTRPARTSSSLDDKAAIATGVWVEYNVLPVTTGDGTYSFALVPISTDSVSFSAREGAQPPQLVIVSTSGSGATNTPLPTATFAMTPTMTPTPSITPTINPDSFTFASMGDIHASVSKFGNAVNQLSTLNPDLIILNGDLDNDGFTNAETDLVVGTLKNADLFNQTFAVRGNHDNNLAGSAALWENYFETAPNIRVFPAGVSNYVSLDSSSDTMNFSYIYGNSMFIGLDDPGGAEWLKPAQLTFLDSRLTYAENAGLVHAFIYFHGPMYCVESVHCNCPTRTDSSCTPSGLITVINKHSIVSAFFHGHEHILGWTHIDNTRLAAVTGSFEEFLTSPGGSTTYNSYLYPDRMDYTYMDVGTSEVVFATITVNGNSFTVNFYKTGTNIPVWTKTFTKGIPVVTNTPTPEPSSTPTFTTTPTATFTSTGTVLAPTATFTPTNTAIPPTATFTSTGTAIAPTATFTSTPTVIPPTATFTPTGTTLPPTATFTPTNTVIPPTATFTSTPGTGSTLTFLGDADSYVRDAGPTSNYGTNTQLWVDYGIGSNYESYLKFTVSGLSGTVQSATLRVYSTSSTVDGPAVYATTTDWTETGVTWNTRPARTSDAMDDKGAIGTGVWTEYNVLPVITGDGIYSFALVPVSADSVSFSAREGSQPSQLVLNIGY